MTDTITLSEEEAELVHKLSKGVKLDHLSSDARTTLDSLVAKIDESQKTRMVTAICAEVGYAPDPLIYVVEITGRITREKVTAAVREERRYDIGEDCEHFIEALTPLIVFEGDLRPVADWRN